MKASNYNYHLLIINSDERVSVIENLDAQVDEYYRLSKGERMGDKFPPTTVLNVYENSGEMLTDFIANIHGVVIISSKVRECFEAEGLGEQQVEYLPFILKDKRGRVIKTQYCVANPLMKVDCFDYERSIYKAYPGRPKEISYPSLRKMCVLEARIPDDAKFFRLGELPDFIIIRSDLLAILRDKQFTGTSVIAMGEELP